MKKIISLLLISIMLMCTGCNEEQLKPDGLSIGYAPPYYEDTEMWRGFNINLQWDL